MLVPLFSVILCLNSLQENKLAAFFPIVELGSATEG